MAAKVASATLAASARSRKRATAARVANRVGSNRPVESARLASLARSIEHRFPYLDPLNHLQVELMRRYRLRREDDPANERLQRGIHLSINGIAAGLRNTG